MCRECFLKEADGDGFCSEYCAKRWEQEMYEDPEGGEA